MVQNKKNTILFM